MREVFSVNRAITVTEFFTLYNPHYDENFNFTGEMHNFWECFYVINGSACVSADERIHNLSTGDIIFHKPMELHKFYITDKNGADLLIFTFNMEGVLCSEMENRVCKLNDEQRNIVDSLIEGIKYDLQEHGMKKCTELINIFPLINNRIGAVQEKATFVEQLILSISQNGNNIHSPKTADAVLFKNSVRFMTENLETALSVDELASYLNVSISGLKRLFTKYAGMSVHKYFLSLKMKKATSLLQSGYTVCEVSDKLGFSSQGYFSAAYKRETGKNPSQIH